MEGFFSGAVHEVMIGAKEKFLIVGDWAVEGYNHGFLGVGIAVGTFDLEFVYLFVGQGRLEPHDTVRIIDVGLVVIASTTATASMSIATATTTVATAATSMLSAHA